METCQFASNFTDAWVVCGQRATTAVQLLPYYDKKMCDEHEVIFTEEDGWTKSPLPAV